MSALDIILNIIIALLIGLLSWWLFLAFPYTHGYADKLALGLVVLLILLSLRGNWISRLRA